MVLTTAGVASAAGKGACNLDVPLKWEILDRYVDGNTVNAIQDDRLSPANPPRPYLHNQDDVIAQIAVCNGTGNAALNVRFQSGPRQAFINFRTMVYVSADTPDWAGRGDTIGCVGYNLCWVFGIQNILYVPSGSDRGDEYEFTTVMGGHGPLFSKLSFFNPGGNVVQPPDQFTAVSNDPYPNSLIRVHHCPASFTGSSSFCVSGQSEQWFVWPEEVPKPMGVLSAPPSARQVATLILNGMKKPRGPVNGGEFSIPFLFKITSLQ